MDKSPSPKDWLPEGLNLELAHLSQDLRQIPEAPGVYIFKDQKGDFLYVGKARDLRKRIASYLHHESPSPKTRALISRATSLEIFLTRNEKEALILEANLIKRYRPRYNIVLRDDKNYPLIRLTIRERFPRVHLVRRRKKDGQLYFGPFTSAKAVKETLRFLGGLFPLRTCGNAEFSRRLRPCLKYQIGRCTAPCVGLISEDDYRQLVDQVILFLRGHKRTVLQRLKKEMEEAAERLEFERAAFLRDRIKAIERTLEDQVVVSQDEKDRDVIGLAINPKGQAAIALLFIRGGQLVGQKGFYFPRATEEGELLNSFIEQFYDEGKLIPEEIILPGPLEASEALNQWLEDLAGHRVRLIWPQRGMRAEMLKLAKDNATEILKRGPSPEGSWEEIAQELKKRLRLPQTPHRVSCVDISNMQSEAPVGSLVSFLDGESDKPAYRHLHLRSPGPDDYTMMAELLSRGLKRGEDLPDLLVVDGGKGQLNVALEIIKDLGLENRISLCALAKERKAEGEKIYLPQRKNPLILSPQNKALLFLMRIRDEAHRFALSFHRRTRAKKALASPLEEIPGIGPRRRARLLEHFGSLEALARASIEEIARVPGMTRPLAKRLDEYLQARYGSKQDK
ncbi:excinuclease ABC subunit UvrC [Thermosulfuriphilus sp.]